jgi:hypothetical protein
MKGRKEISYMNRRCFMRTFGATLGGIIALMMGVENKRILLKTDSQEKSPSGNQRRQTTPISNIYMSRNGTPEGNVTHVIESMGGIQKLINPDDIVVIKPNAQWRGHGGSNTNAIKGFIDLVLAIPNFNGEIIIAENHHAAIDNSLGWTTTHRNGDFNLNELVEYFNQKGYPNVTKYHWHDAGPNPVPLQFPGGDGHRVDGPEQGDGYVWTDEDFEFEGRKTKMTYPVFTSAHSGVTIDFKNGAWKDGDYTQQPIKFVNFATLNHHSPTFGVTASIKNYLGVVDMTCGVHGTEPEGFYNFHYVGLGWSREHLLGNFVETNLTSPGIQKFKTFMKCVRHFGPFNGATGGAVGHFMNTVRQADLNIIAAEFVGHEGRQVTPVQMRTVLASTDPVALDYYAAKYVLYPLGGKHAKYNNPDWTDGPFRKTLDACHDQGIGTLDEDQMTVHIS